MGSLRYSTESFEFDVRREPPELTVRLYGALDLATAPFLEIPEHELGALPTLVVDLAELRFCDLAGLQVLHRLCQSQSAAGRRVRMVHARPALLKLAQLSGLVSPCPGGVPRGHDLPEQPDDLTSGPPGADALSRRPRPRRPR